MKMNPLNETDAVIIACAMMEDEVKLALHTTGCTLPVVWGERSLHDKPQRLQDELNRMVAAQSAKTILLAYGLCGNALLGVSSQAATLVLPRYHDCVWMFLSHEEGVLPKMDIRSLYYTRGNLAGEGSLYHGYRQACQKYGSQKAKGLYRQMLGHYKAVTMLDTGSYPLEECRPLAQSFAGEMELDLLEENGTVRILEKLFSGRWDEEFCITPPGGRFCWEQFSQANQSLTGGPEKHSG